MTKKILFIISALVIGLLAFMGFKIISLENNSNAYILISLFTDPNPPVVGPVNFTITTKDSATVSYSVNMTNMNMGEQKGTAVSAGNGNYKGSGRFSMRGPWRIAVTAILPNGEKLYQNFDYNVR